jgi:hypothetical protein
MTDPAEQQDEKRAEEFLEAFNAEDAIEDPGHPDDDEDEGGVASDADAPAP